MQWEDEEKMAFIIEQGTYCFQVMPFGLKNAETMFQRLMNEIFSRIKLARMWKFMWMTFLLNTKEQKTICEICKKHSQVCPR